MNRTNYYPNMDLVRYLLAIGVIIAHVNFLAGYQVPFVVSSFEAVGGFFALSGFLMYPNYKKHGNLVKYTRQRAQRILPPYVFIVIVAAVFLSFVSALSIRDYFTSAGLYEYLAANLSFLNWLHPELPGVFEGVEYSNHAVNGSLWTMKVEWCLYLSMPLFVWILGRSRKLRPEWFALVVVALSIVYRYGFYEAYQATGKEIYSILGRQIFGQLCYFYFGVLIWIIKDYFVKHIWIMLVAGIVMVEAGDWIESWSVLASYIVNPFAVSVLVLAISLLPWDIRWLRHKGNISYEMYLFHYPLIQLGVWLGIGTYGMLTEFCYVFASTVALSIIAHIIITKLKSRNFYLC